MSASRQSLTRFMAIFAGGTLLSRLLGLVRDILVANMVPFAAREIFLFAFKFPNMLRDMLGEGAVNAAYVPLFSRTLETEGQAAFTRLVRACFGAAILLFAVLSVLGVLAASLLPVLLGWLQPFTGTDVPDASELELKISAMRWTMPYLFFIGTAVFAMGPLFVMRHYGTPSWSPLLLNVALIGACLVNKDYFSDPVWALVAGVWLGGVAQMGVMMLAMKRHAGVLLPSLELNHPGIRKAMILLVPVVLGQATGEVNKVVDALFAVKLEAVSVLYFANRMVQLPLSIFGIAVAVAILPSISAAAARDDRGEIRETLLHGFRQSAFLVLPALAGLLVLGEPLMRLFFSHAGGEFSVEEAHRAGVALQYYAWGLLTFAWVKVGVQGFFAMHDTKTPVVVASISMLMNILLNMALVGPMGYQGLALATSISYGANFLGLYLLLWRRFGPLWSPAFVWSLARTLMATVLMGGVVYGLHRSLATILPGDATLLEAVRVFAPVAAGAVAYPAFCLLLRSEDVGLLRSLMRRVRAGRKVP